MRKSILVLLVAGAAASDTDVAVAERAVAAVRAGAADVLRSLATSDVPDPWLVVDQLCLRGEHDVAAEFARAAPRKAIEGLPAYVNARRDRATPPSLREARERAIALLGRNPAEAAATLADIVPGDDIVSIRATCVRADAYGRMRRWEDSERDYVAAAEAAMRVGWIYRAGQAYSRAILAALARDAAPAAAAHGRRAVEFLRHAGRPAQLAGTLINLGLALENSGHEDAALAAYREGIAIARKVGHDQWAAHGLNNVASVLSVRGEYLDALEAYRESLALLDRLGSPGAATTRMNMGVVHYKLGAYPRAIATYERVLPEFREAGDVAGEIRTLTNLGNVLLAQGRQREAADRFESARAIALREKKRRSAAKALHNLAVAHEKLGNLATALDLYERAIEELREVGHPAELAATQSDLGDLHRQLGDYARARAAMQQALATLRRLGRREDVATTLGSLGVVHEVAGAHAEARRCYEEQLRLAVTLGSPRSRLDALTNLGNLARGLERLDEAVRHYDAALSIAREIGTRANVGALLMNLGLVAETRGDVSGALARYRAALAEAEAAGHRQIAVSALTNMSRTHGTLGDARAAVNVARRAVETVARIGGGLADEQGSRVRGRWASIYETGVDAARALGDPAAAAYFLETGRAASLVETLRVRSALRDTVLPAALREAEEAAQADVHVAGWHHRRAVARGTRKDVESARAKLADAHRTLEAVIARIQRTEKAGADLLYGHVASLAELRALLKQQEAMILYGLFERSAMALVVTRAAARIAPLGDARAIVGACGALELRSRRADPDRALRRLEELVIRPLGLEARSRRILVSPDGPLAEIPFGLLAKGREVAYIPSGTAYRLLRDRGRRRGRGVLALGDPDYAAAGRLPRLPATRAEASSIGDVVLLGSDASVPRLRDALGQDRTWRAVHLACHGLMRTDEPLLSALALAPAPESDGRISVRDVFRLKVRADLVALSACETARGKVYRAEGVVGFPRAFMVAGATRVLVSLWQVDDVATRELMVRFYELWNGTPGLAAATALRKAQEHVASHAKWRAPYFWAGWQLWGVPD